AKTTIADTEIVLSDGSFRAVVTFVSRDEVVDALTECASEAALAANRDASDEEVLRKLLEHANQRFRFSYILGRNYRLGTAGDVQLDEDDDDEDQPEIEPEDLALLEQGKAIDFSNTAMILGSAVGTLRDLVADHGKRLR